MSRSHPSNTWYYPSAQAGEAARLRMVTALAFCAAARLGRKGGGRSTPAWLAVTVTRTGFLAYRWATPSEECRRYSNAKRHSPPLRVVALEQSKLRPFSEGN